MAEKDEENENVNTLSGTIKKKKRIIRWNTLFIIIVVVAVVAITLIAAAVLKNIIRLGAVKNSNDSDDDNYREYGPGAYSESIVINTEDAENATISFEMSVDEMWESDERYSKYLTSVDELEYMLNAEFVTQFPYIESAEEDELNGVIRFYRNDSEDEMVYVPYDTLTSYMESYNSGDTSVLDEALNCFTLDEDNTIIVLYLTEESYNLETNDAGTAENALSQISNSSSSQNSDGTYVVGYSSSTLETKNINYLNYVKKYTLPFNLLWSIVVMGHSHQAEAIELALSIADMAYDSEISLIIDDKNMYSSETQSYTYNLTDYYNGTVTASVTGTYTEVETNQQGETVVTNGNLSLSNAGSSITIDDYTVDTSCYATYTETHNENSPTIVIKRIEAWCAIFENDATYEATTTSNSDNPSVSTLDDSEEVHIADLSVDEAIAVPIPDLVSWRDAYEAQYQDKTETEEDGSYSITYDYTTSYKGTIAQTQNYTSINRTIVTTTINTGYNNGTVTSPVFNEEIAEKFNSSNVAHVRNTICDADDDGWFIPALEVNEDTANMIDLMKYIINVANGDENELDWETVWSQLYSNYSSLYGGTSGISGDIGIIYDFFLEKGVSAQGVAAIIGNLMAESGCISNNLQNSYNNSWGISDEEYTAMVNNGSYSKYSFTHDSGGYGLAQWTYYTRKQGLYEFAESYSDDFDISNIYMQLEYLWQELNTTHTAALSAIKDATDVATATRQFCDLFEAPLSANYDKRIEYAEQYYQEYLNNQSSSSSSGGIDENFSGMFEWPLSHEYTTITSVFGYRTAPLPGASTNHKAIDISVSYAPVYAAASGTVVYASWGGTYGNYIKIDHGNGYYTAYAHLSAYKVSVGDNVSTGQQIAISGSTGNSTAPHLHYEVFVGGSGTDNRVDPLLYTNYPG